MNYLINRGPPSPFLTEQEHPDLDMFFDALTQLYLEADIDVRNQIRRTMTTYTRPLGNISGYSARAARKLKETRNQDLLLRGLASASIDDGSSGKVFGRVLGLLWRAASECGVQPRVYFSRVAKLSSKRTGSFLEDFGSSPDFAAFVRPHLKNVR
jgi:hypothetical protein